MLPLVVPVGKKIRVVTTANDVIHAWMVPAFGVKQDAIPGFVRDTWFKAEKLGTYNPQLAKDDENRIKMDMERVQYWIGTGAQPTDRVSRFLEAAGVISKKTRANPKTGTPGKNAVARAESKAGKAAKAPEAAAAPAPVEEAPVEAPAEAAADAPAETSAE